MELFTGKKGIIMGLANERSIAWAIAQSLKSQGAELGFSHLPDKEGSTKLKDKINRIVEPLQPKLVLPCNVSSDEDVQRFFNGVRETFGKIDFLVHSIAYADISELNKPVYQVSRDGFKVAMDISVYSLMSICNAAIDVLSDGASILAMTYYGGEKVVTGYNIMGVCKAALDSTVKYLANDLGERNIRVNAISAGPIKTLAGSAVKVDQMIKLYSDVAPLRRSVALQEVGNSAMYLLSDLSSAVTGEIHHVDSGYSIIGGGVRSNIGG